MWAVQHTTRKVGSRATAERIIYEGISQYEPVELISGVITARGKVLLLTRPANSTLIRHIPTGRLYESLLLNDKPIKRGNQVILKRGDVIVCSQVNPKNPEEIIVNTYVVCRVKTIYY